VPAVNVLLESAIKISLLIALGLLAGALCHRRSAALRHWMLAASMAAALATPLLMWVAPSWSLPAAAQIESRNQPPRWATASRPQPRVGIATSIEAESSRTASPSPRQIGPSSVLLAVWIAGVVINFIGLLLGFWRLRRIAVRATIVRGGPWFDTARQLSEHFGVRTPVTLLQSDRPALLMTWGVFAPKVLLPVDAASWDVDRIRVVLAHEFAHIRRHDWIVQIGSELLRILNWFNPLVWLASARLRLESERACDDAVVNLGVSGSEYAEHLLDLARQWGRAGPGPRADVPFPAVAIVPRSSQLERRVTAMLNVAVRRHPISRTVRAATLVAILAVAIPIALFAQNTFVTISGTIVDQSGGVLPGVEVMVIDRARPAQRRTVTDGAGRFRFVGVPQGSHTLQSTLAGFETFTEQVTVSGENIQRKIVLNVGAIAETVSVRGPGGPRNTFPAPGERLKARPVNCGGAPRQSWPPDPPPGGPIRVGGYILAPNKLYSVPPVYPEGAPSGVVIMRAVIGPDGYVRETEVLRNPSPVLAQAATEAVRQWEFEPTLLNCVAVPVRMMVTVVFN
jgi:beta-lactamase regulating signal transducer with metallopeptidase domain